MSGQAYWHVDERARRSGGISNDAIYQMVTRVLTERGLGRGRLIDVGCGTGNLWNYVQAMVGEYIGADVVRYDGFPAELTLCLIDLDNHHVPLPDGAADTIVAVETIEHLENPRSFMRELVRLAKPGGSVVITTPNQLSWLSKMTLVVKNQFNAFQEGSYPAHLTALLEVDLRRIAAECGLTEIGIAYSQHGRMPGFVWHFPALLSRCWPRAFSDNVLMVGKKPAHAAG